VNPYLAIETLENMANSGLLPEGVGFDKALQNYLKSINKGLDFNRPGTIIKVANFGKLVSTPVARIIADKGKKQVRAYDAGGKLIAAFPATIGSADTPSPSGTHTVTRIVLDPNYTYNPNINFKQGQNDKILTIPPGPRGPVGSVWIALDKPTYGIHGTPDPSKIGKTESHGCVRLTNWDARELAKIVSPGVTVEFVD
jgi:lipoprotein-anchoring transpeptidase ErfK/SrfK